RRTREIKSHVLHRAHVRTVTKQRTNVASKTQWPSSDLRSCRLRISLWAWQRFQVFNQIEFLTISQPQIKVNVVVIDNVQQCSKPTVVIKPALVRWTHEQALFADEETVQVHRLVNVVWPSVGLEAVDADLLRLVQ